MKTNKFWLFLKLVVTSHSGISSKRVCGVIGWLVVLGIALYTTILAVNPPDIIDSIILATVALLGVDSITGIWKGK